MYKDSGKENEFIRKKKKNFLISGMFYEVFKTKIYRFSFSKFSFNFLRRSKREKKMSLGELRINRKKNSF